MEKRGVFLRELAQILKPRKLEQRTLRDLRQALATRDENDEVRIVRSAVFYAYLSGKIAAVLRVHQHHDYSMGDFDFTNIRDMRTKHLRELDAIKQDREHEDEARTNRRVQVFVSTLIWEAYNLGRLSSFRQRAQGKVGAIPD